MPAANSITGLNSGLDWAAIIDATIEWERNDAVILEWDQAQKQEIVSAYQALQAKFLALSVELSKLSDTETFEQSTVNVSDSSILSATTDGRVSSGSYDVQVLSLARNHQLASQGFTDSSVSSFGTGTISIQVGDGAARTVTIDSGNNSLVGIKKAINDADLGVSASIINDGSGSNPYRLILTGDNPGVANTISVTSNLTGGDSLNYASSSFDSPENVFMDSGSSAQISLGAMAAYTGSENKIYTFTVGGTGTQTVGTDNITLDWTDGTNSGSIIVTQADTEVELVGAGADGLTLTFSAGDLNSGDTFQVGTFSPLLQQASDARIMLGSSGGGGSPITINSETNSFNDLIGGLSMTVHQETEPGESVVISTDQDIAGIRGQIESFIARYNEATEFIDEQNTYDQDENKSGALFGDYTVWNMENKLSSYLGSTIPGIDTQFSQLYSIGIRTTGSGKLAITNSSRLDDALRNNLDDVISLFACAGNSSSTYVEYMSSTADTEVGRAFDVDITQAATHGTYQGAEMADPATSALTLTSSTNRMRLTVDGLTSDEIILTAKTYETSDELIREIQAQMDNDNKIGERGVTVEWVSTGVDTGYLNIISSTWGSSSTIELVDSQLNSAYALTGLSSGEAHEGLDVAGTISGEEAEGKGQVLTGKEDNATTDGLKLKITIDESQIVAGYEASITVSKGIAARMSEYIDSLTMSTDGTIDRRIKGYQGQIELLTERITEIDELLEIRRQSLYDQYYQMETILGALNSEGDYLSQQLAGLNMNWKFNQD